MVVSLACGQMPESSRTSSSAARLVTFNKDVAPILYANCVTCHRPVDPAAAPRGPGLDDPLCIAGAPFSLLDYQSAFVHAREIVEATDARKMPPWLPQPGHGRFVNERRLRDDEIATIRQWVQQGAPQGEPADAPQPPSFAEGWQLGEPDLVVELPEAYTLERGSGDVFRNFVVPAPVGATRYVRGLEFRALNPRALHHANVAVDPSRSARKLDRADGGPGFASMPDDLVQNVYGWSPGKVPVLEPADTAWTLEPGSDLVVQLHMVGSGNPERIQPALGLFFSERPPSRTPVVIKLESKAIDIPAGQSDYVLEDSYVLPADVEAVTVYPHAHYLAREMKGVATLPDGTNLPLLWIRQWDVRWQDQYRYREPVFLPKGTTVSMRFTYDNSEANARNPHRPPRRVTWGPFSTDEMGALWLEVVPRRNEDVAVLTRDYSRRALATEIGRAEMLVRSAPADPAARNLLATKYVQAGRIGEARQHLQEALRLKRDDAETHSNLGSVLQLQGQLEAATAHLEQAVRLAPGDDRVRVNLANAIQAAGRLAAAERELRRAIGINPDNPDAHFNLAMLLGPQNRLDEAARHLRRLLEINPQHAEGHRNLAVALGLQGRLDEAIQHAQTSLRIQPGSAQTREHLDRLLAARRRP